MAKKKSDIGECRLAWEGLRTDPKGTKNGIYVNNRAPAQMVHEIISMLEEENGGKCSQEDLVKYARKCKAAKHPHHEFYKCFQWDSVRGAQQYRLQQAGLIFRTLVVVVVPKDPKQDSISGRRTVSVRDDGTGRSYTNIFAALDDPDDLNYLWDQVTMARNAYIRKLEIIKRFEAESVTISKLLAHELKGTTLITKVSADIKKPAKKTTKKPSLMNQKKPTTRKSQTTNTRKPARKTARKKKRS